MTQALPAQTHEPYKSTTHILGMLAILMRNRFGREDTSHAFRWDADPVATNLHIQTYLETAKQADNAYPRIVIGRGNKVSAQSGINDHDQNNPELLKKQGTYYIRFADLDVYIDCVAETLGEAEALGDVVWATIEMSRNEICRAMTVRQVSSVMLDPAQPYRKDATKFATRVGFRLQFELRWFSIEAGRPLASMTVQELNDEASAYVVTHILRSDELPDP